MRMTRQNSRLSQNNDQIGLSPVRLTRQGSSRVGIIPQPPSYSSVFPGLHQANAEISPNIRGAKRSILDTPIELLTAGRTNLKGVGNFAFNSMTPKFNAQKPVSSGLDDECMAMLGGGDLSTDKNIIAGGETSTFGSSPPIN